jgi:hypothetical protein
MRSKSRSALLLVLTYSKRNWKMMMMMMMMTHQKSKPPNLPSFLPSFQAPNRKAPPRSSQLCEE